MAAFDTLDGTHPQPIPGRTTPRYGNTILDALPPAQQTSIAPLLERISLREGSVLLNGDPYFPMSATISVRAKAEDGVEVALIGSEGVVGGLSLLHAGNTGLFDKVLIPGAAWWMSRSRMDEYIKTAPELKAEMLRYVYSLVGQMADNAAALARATIRQRTARRLLLMADRVGPTVLTTHGELAEILSTRRAGVTMALHYLQGKGLVEVGRAQVVVTNLAGLIQEATYTPRAHHV